MRTDHDSAKIGPEMPPAEKAGLERQIASLLDRVSETNSVFDRLMAIPVQADEPGEAPEWDRAVARRLERQLVEMMQAALGEEPQRRRA